jgi:hypothetical protein
MTLKAQATQYHIEDTASRRKSPDPALDRVWAQRDSGFLSSASSVALSSPPPPPNAEQQAVADLVLPADTGSCADISQERGGSVDIMIFCDAENRDGRTDGASQNIQSDVHIN